MAGRRARTRKGERRIDAAIDHFTQMGYDQAHIRSTVDQLLEVYGQENWKFLEEDAYRVVHDAFFEKEEQEEKPQLLLEQGEQTQEKKKKPQPQEKKKKKPQQQQQHEPQKKEATMSEAPVEVRNEILVALEGVDLMLIDLPTAPEATMSHPAATGTGCTRHPCYGWISESESDSDYEEQPASQQHEVHVPGLGGGLVCKRKRPSGWDVK